MIRIGIVDDHALIRVGIRQLCVAEVDIKVVGEADNGRGAIDLVRNVELDVLIMDISMPGQSGIDVLSLIRAKAADLPILIMSAHPEETYAASVIRQGANGYINKNCPPEEIIQAVRHIAIGRNYISPSVENQLDLKCRSSKCAPIHESLTHREFQVFLKLAKGATPSEIADNLSLNVRTIGHHRTKIFRKMNLKTNSDLTYYAVKHFFIE